MVGNLALALDVSSFEGKSAFEICGYKRDSKSQLIVTILEKDVLNFVDCKPKYGISTSKIRCNNLNFKETAVKPLLLHRNISDNKLV